GILLFTGVDPDPQSVLSRRQRTRCVPCERARRVVRLVEIKHCLAIRTRGWGVNKTPRPIGFSSARRIGKDDKKVRGAFLEDRIELVALAVDLKYKGSR